MEQLCYLDFVGAYEFTHVINCIAPYSQIHTQLEISACKTDEIWKMSILSLWYTQLTYAKCYHQGKLAEAYLEPLCMISFKYKWTYNYFKNKRLKNNQ